MRDEHRFEDMEKTIKLERDICRTAASFYEQAALDGCDIHEFSDRYLDSTFCTKSMQTKYSPLQREDAITCLEHLYPKIGGPETMIYGKKGMIFDPDAAWWFGYTYQQLYFETGVKGTELKEKVPFSMLSKNYAAHHTLDEIYSTDMLCSYFGLEKDSMHIAYGQMLDSRAGATPGPHPGGGPRQGR